MHKNRAYGLVGQINTYKDYVNMMTAYNFSIQYSYEQWVKHQEQEDLKFCKEWPREFKWTKNY